MPLNIVSEVTPKNRWQRILHWEYLGLFIIVAVTLAFHFVAIERPPTIVWDEKWYVGDVRSIISGRGDIRPEHPPLAKFFIIIGEFVSNGFTVPEKDSGVCTQQLINAIHDTDSVIQVSDASQLSTGTTIRIDSEQMDIQSKNPVLNTITVTRGAGGTTISSHASQKTIYVFTDNAFGWRFFSIIFGTLGIILFYFICRKLGFSWKATMLATFLFAFDDMTFLHSGLALLDVYMITFMLAAVLSYLDEKYLLAGLFVALSTECKLTGVLIIIAIFLHWVIFRRDKWKTVVGSLLFTLLSFVFLLVFFDFFFKGTIENPITRIHALIMGSTTNTFTIPKLFISSRPWTWLYPQWILHYFNSPNVPYIVYSAQPQWVSFISTTIQILIIPTFGYMIYKAIKGSKPAGFIVFWFLATYLVWIPLDIITNRVTYLYYFLSTTPAICIGLGMAISEWLDRLRTRYAEFDRIAPGEIASFTAIFLYLVFHLAIFIVFNPAIPTTINLLMPPFGYK